MLISEFISKLETNTIPQLKEILTNVGDLSIALNVKTENIEIRTIDICHGNIQDKVFVVISVQF